ncbi:MAG: LytR C-terminal domain-containing protein [Synechococcaceae cyanobacterium]|nr:LytR C-terminal domain-containing protein [Synechococcaceae cyanobacterium]
MKRRTLAIAAVGTLAVMVVAWAGLRAREAPARSDGKPIRVEVRNGSGVHRAGLGLAEALRDRGFDVVDIRNADRNDYAETVVLDRVGRGEYAARVADALGISGWLEQRNEDLLLEVTVILGRDRGAQYGRAR